MEMDFEKICRTCLSGENSTLVSIFENNITDMSESESSSVIDLLTTLTNIKISISDGLPRQICGSCVDEVKQIFYFKLKCRNSQAVLSSHLYNMSIMQDNSLKINNDVKYEDENKQRTDTNNEIQIKIEKDLKEINYDYDLNPTICLKEEIIEEDEAELSDSPEKKCELSQDNDLLIESKRDNRSENESIENYQCECCYQNFDDQKNLIAHIKSNHTDGLKCKICNKEYKTAKILRLHCIVHAPQEYACKHCGKTFKQYKYLQRHVLLHIGDKPYKCKLCEKGFIGEKELKRHALSHQDRIINCDICGLRFKTKYNLNAHRSRHVKSRDFKCDKCPKAFLTRLELKMHIRVHTGISPYYCSICHKTFTQYSNLKKHNLRFHKISSTDLSVGVS